MFDLTLPLDQVEDGYRAIDERHAIKDLFVPWIIADLSTLIVRRHMIAGTGALAAPSSAGAHSGRTPIRDQRNKEWDIGTVRNSPKPSRKGPEPWSAGTVGIDPLHAPARASAGLVDLKPVARKAWHTHPVAQMLIIVSGSGWVQREGGPIEDVRPGDVV